MKRSALGSLLTKSLVFMLLALVLPGAASAHEGRTVLGKYQFQVGFLDEPPVTGQMNALDLRVTVPSESNRPVEGLEKTLRATVIVGGNARTMDLPLEPSDAQPGAYVAQFIPTRAGSYIFELSGTVEGAAIDERFESGPGRFNDVQSAQSLQFPDRSPDAASLAQELSTARQDASIARLLGIAGVLVGIAGLVVGSIALRRQRAASPVETTRAGERTREAA